MEIMKGIEAIGKALWLKKEKILILADLHMGYEEYLNEKGILAPRQQFRETKKDLGQIFKKIKTKPNIIIINGDLKHEFGKISGQEWQETNDILDLLKKNCKKIILIKGNHDTILEPIARRKNAEIRDFFSIRKGKICILHGNKIRIENNVNKAKILVIAHEHPAVSLREGSKAEIYKCFLTGKWKGKKIIVMASFMPLIEGSDVKKEKLLSPYLKDIRNFNAFIISDKIYKFGRVKEI